MASANRTPSKPVALRHFVRELICLATGLLIALLACANATAQYTYAESFITLGGRQREVLRVEAVLETPPSMTMGLASVTVSTGTGQPSRADRDLAIVFYLKSYGQASNDAMAYRVPVRLPEGQSKVEVQIPHVSPEVQAAWDVGIFENGRDIEDDRGSSRNDTGFQWTYNGDRQAALATLTADDEPTGSSERQIRRLNELLLHVTNTNRGSNETKGSLSLPIAAASSDWRRYFPYAAWILSANAVREVNANDKLAAALRKYVAAGGVLLVHGVSGSEDTLAVGDLLGDSATSEIVDSWRSIKSPDPSWWWIDPDAEGFPTVTNNATAGYGGGSYGGGSYGGGGYGGEGYGSGFYDWQRPRSLKAQSQHHDQPSALTVGGVLHDAAIVADTVFEAKLNIHLELLDGLSWLLWEADSLSSRVNLQRRRLLEFASSEQLLGRDYIFGKVYMAQKPLEEISLDLLDRVELASNTQLGRINSDMDGVWFWRNLIRAVGKPPVWIFCGIVTLFGLVLGPGLLLVTGRLKRRSLMLFLVPAISLVTMLAIIGYGVLHEGFATHFRVTSVQRLAPGNGQGFAWSRQNYFSGAPPREGLYLRGDTYARPVYPDDESYGRSFNYDPRTGVDCYVTLLDNQQNWRSWLKTRQQQQLLIGHDILQPQAPIAIERDASDTAIVENVGHSSLPIVVFRDREERYYVAEDLRAGSRQTLKPMDLTTARATAARLVTKFRPSMPEELRERSSLLDFGRSGSNWVGADYEIGDIVNTFFQRGLSDKLELSAFEYAVLATESEAIEVPVDGQSSENLHLIMGFQVW